MADSFFGDDQSPATEEDNTSEQPNLSYVGEGKKYTSVEDLDKAYANAELHIKKLEAEHVELRKLAERDSKMDEILQRLEEKKSSSVDRPVPENPSKAVTEDDVLRVVEQREQVKQQEANRARVVNTLKDRFGDKAPEVFQRRGEELGLDLQQLALVSPSAVLELFPKSGTTPQSSPPGQAAPASGNNYGTYQFWVDQYRNGKLSRDAMIQNQHKSLSAMGPEAFYKK